MHLNYSQLFEKRGAQAFRPPAHNGFSLIEVMVGLVIALVTTLVIAQVFAAFEGQKRTTASGSDSQQNGIMGLFQVDKDIRAAGYGIANASAYACAAPVVITPGGAGSPDSISVRLGDSATQPSPAQFLSLAGNQITITNPLALGYQANDFLLLHQPLTAVCDIVQISAITVPGAGFPAVLTVNPAPVGAYVANQAEIYNLGLGYVVRTFAIDPATNRLTQSDGGPPVELADNIVSLKAQYGKDDGSNGGTPDDGVVDTYNATPPVVSLDWQRVITIRLSVIARSPLQERNAVTNPCTTPGGTVNTGPCAWNDTIASPSPQITLTGSWQNFRYFVYDTIVPVRNSMWKR